MCVAAVAWDCHPELVLVAIANRDEFHARPTAALDRWPGDPRIIAGRDLRSGGTWLGVSESGHFALLTNFRDPDRVTEGRPSRGSVVTDLLRGREPAGIGAMNPLNVFHAQAGKARIITNHPEVREHGLGAGVHGISNGAFDTPWPKTRQLCDALAGWLHGDVADTGPLFTALRAETPRPDDPAPFHAPEPDYAPVFINNPEYGTRCSTLVTIARDGTGTMTERSFDAAAQPVAARTISFRWPAV
jgi:uncharacterized protein with NRDE domain